jgi:hypothetical protein
MPTFEEEQTLYLLKRLYRAQCRRDDMCECCKRRDQIAEVWNAYNMARRNKYPATTVAEVTAEIEALAQEEDTK